MVNFDFSPLPKNSNRALIALTTEKINENE